MKIIHGEFCLTATMAWNKYWCFSDTAGITEDEALNRWYEIRHRFKPPFLSF